jgi:HlyD family secretion protein
MLAENATSKALFDVRQTEVQTKKQTLQSAQAQADAAQAQASAAHSRADAAQQQIGVALAQAERTKSRIKDATLISPVTGRVLYRLVEPGEVLGPGGKALTLVDLSDVYMEIYLPSDLAAALKFGADARITVDFEPNAAAAGHVTFVSPQAQFTPKQVETKNEREKLMFRVKIQIPPDLVEHYIERIKTGVRGVGYVKVNPSAKWPEWLEKGLLNPERVSESESSHSSGTSQ